MEGRPIHGIAPGIKKLHAAIIKKEQDSVSLDSNMFKHPHDSVTPLPETDSKKRKVKNAKKNTKELKQAPNANETPNSSITGIDSCLGSNFLVQNHYNYYNSAYIINSDISITHYL